MVLNSAALKAAVVVAALAVLVMPSFGRCPSLGLAPPAAAPVYVHASGPTPEPAPPAAAPGPAPDLPAPVPLADAPVPASGPTFGPTSEPDHETCSECASRCAKGCNGNAYEPDCTDYCSPQFEQDECDICRSIALIPETCEFGCNSDCAATCINT